jgi:hypothetical protein
MRLILILTLLSALMLAPAARAAVNCDVAPVELAISGPEQDLLNTLNAQRTAKLSWDPTLIRMATWMAYDQAWTIQGPVNPWTGINHHIDSLGRDLRQRATDCDYPTSLPVAENVSAGPQLLRGDVGTLSALTSTTADWLNSLSTQYTHIGIAQVINNNTQPKNYWVLVFGRTGGTPPATPVPPTATPLPTLTLVPTATPVPPPATPVPTATPVEEEVDLRCKFLGYAEDGDELWKCRGRPRG